MGFADFENEDGPKKEVDLKNEDGLQNESHRINEDDPNNEDHSWNEYQPSCAGGTRSPPATPHWLQRRTACKIQNGH